MPRVRARLARLQLHAGCVLDPREGLEYARLGLLERAGRVVVLHVRDGDVQLVVGRVVVHVLVPWDVVRDILWSRARACTRRGGWRVLIAAKLLELLL